MTAYVLITIAFSTVLRVSADMIISCCLWGNCFECISIEESQDSKMGKYASVWSE